MSLRDKLEDRIKKKKEEIEDLRIKIREAEAYFQGLQDALKYLPRESKDEASDSIVRPGSRVHKVLNLLRTVGKPMHINEILKGVGLPATKEAKVSLSGSLAWYVRKNEVFTRPEPNTFGLISMNKDESDEPPDNFGIGESEDDEILQKDLEKQENGKTRFTRTIPPKS